MATRAEAARENGKKGGRRTTAQELELDKEHPEVARIVGDPGKTAASAEACRLRLLKALGERKVSGPEFDRWDGTLKSIIDDRQERESEQRSHRRQLAKIRLDTSDSKLRHERALETKAQIDDLRRIDAELDAKIARLAFLEELAARMNVDVGTAAADPAAVETADPTAADGADVGAAARLASRH